MVTDCRLKSLAGGLEVAPNPKSRHLLKTIAMPTASGLLQSNLLSNDHSGQNGYVLCIVLYDNTRRESCTGERVFPF